MCRRILAMTLAFLLTGISLPGQSAQLGVVALSAGGHLNNTAASVGTTIYSGDRLATEMNGTLGLRSGPVQLQLPENSAILVTQEDTTLTAVLQRGSIGFRVESGGALRLVSADVRVRPLTSALTAGQMTLENCAVVVTSRLQSLEVTAGKETKIVEEGQSYRVVIDGSCGNQKNRSPIALAHGRFFLIPTVVGIITGLAVQEALESPDRP
jgi:ferric-dicitrate binding protein FerR (iron transport regulator)